MLGNGTEYQHALQEDAQPKGQCMNDNCSISRLSIFCIGRFLTYYIHVRLTWTFHIRLQDVLREELVLGSHVGFLH